MIAISWPLLPLNVVEKSDANETVDGRADSDLLVVFNLNPGLYITKFD